MPSPSRSADFVPPYQSFGVVRDVVKTYAMGMIGVQFPTAEDATWLVFELLGMFGLEKPGRPTQVEQAEYVDEHGCRNHVLMPYWSSGAEMGEFMERDDFQTWRNTPRTGPIGWWIERMWGSTESADVASAARVRYGVGRNAERELLQYHGYMGSMRDRVPDYLSGKADGEKGQIQRLPAKETKCKHLVLDDLPHNLCFIRGPFGCKHASLEEQKAFNEVIVPVLDSASEYLRKNPLESNCISLRQATEVHNGFDNETELEIMGWFLTLQDLERWTAQHESHLRVLRAAGQFHKRFNFKSVVNQGHEVFVLPKGQVECEYVNCHPDTGFLPYFPAREVGAVA